MLNEPNKIKGVLMEKRNFEKCEVYRNGKFHCTTFFKEIDHENNQIKTTFGKFKKFDDKWIHTICTDFTLKLYGTKTEITKNANVTIDGEID